MTPSNDFHTNHRKCTHTEQKTKTNHIKTVYEQLQYHHIYNSGLHIYSHSCPGQYEHIYNSRLIHENNLFMNLHHAFEQQWD